MFNAVFRLKLLRLSWGLLVILALAWPSLKLSVFAATKGLSIAPIKAKSANQFPTPANPDERVAIFALPGEVSASSIIPADANALAEAMNLNSSDIIAASLNGSDTQGVGVGNAQLAQFPSEGSTFAILSTGLAESADDPDNEGSLSHTLGGLNNSQGNDLVQLGLKLQVPTNANCLNFDFAYFSEEFPEYVGSIFNDTFTAELGGTNLIIQGTEVSAPLNIAFDTSGNIISINTVFGVDSNDGTTYDAGTSLLRARAGVTPGNVIDLVFSVQDLGDSIYDSAVFLDKFFWSNDDTCGGGEVDADTDGDGLLDSWETRGITVTVPGIDLFEFVNLPAMGADPQKKDIFAEIDYMLDQGICIPLTQSCFWGHSHQPDQAALDRVVDAFANAPVSNPDDSTGIQLHVDNGPTSRMNAVTGTTWGDLSRANSLSHTNTIGSDTANGYSWDDFQAIKDNPDNFSRARATIFHYVVFAHNLGGYGGTSGISRNGNTDFFTGASDFIVSLGSWTNNVGTVSEQAGTFMHELGHNLGLAHGGGDHTNFKPNYLSIMSYAFQTDGLTVSGNAGNFDYSRFLLPDLDENQLNEPIGLTGGPNVNTYSTKHWCGVNNERISVSSAVDWNCDNDTNDQGVQYNINEGVSTAQDTTLGLLSSYNDWENLIFAGGAIGQPGTTQELPAVTDSDELTFEQDQAIEKLYALAVGAPGNVAVLPETTLILSATVSNIGSKDDVYNLSTTATYPWVTFGNTSSIVALPSGSSTIIPISVTVPATASLGSVLEIKLRATSQTNPLITDIATIHVVLASAINDGWNLISFPVYPTNPAVTGVLKQVDEYVNVALGFEQGGSTFFPDTPEFNTLTRMDAKHGYWVNLKESGFLIVDGTEYPLNTPIFLEQGWNLVGYLPDTTLPVTSALATISGKYDKVLGYDQGATTFYAGIPPQLNTLQVMERGKGYWIYMTESGTLDYSQATMSTVNSASLRLGNKSQSTVGIAATNEWLNVYSTNSTYNGRPLPFGSVVTAIGEDGRPLGAVAVRESGWYGVLAVYHDDGYTSELDGARTGERISFLINGQPATITNGATPTWTANGDLAQVDLAASGPEIDKHFYLPLVQR